MKKLVIIGAGGFAREVAWLVEDINTVDKEWELLGFIDENTANHGKFLNDLPVLGDFDFFYNQVKDEPIFAVCAVGNPRSKMNLVGKASEWGFRFANLIHPSVKMSRYLEMGVGNIICAGSVITTNITVRNHVAINPGCGIGHDVIIKDFSTILWSVNLSGNVCIETGCEVGTKTVVIQGVNIGEWSTIGAGAAVVRDIPPYCTAVGVPAKPVNFTLKQIGKVNDMFDKVALKIAPANLFDRDAVDKVEEQIVNTLSFAEVYHLEPPKGEHRKAAFDWIILAKTADVITIGLALWQIYERVIKPRKKNKSDDNGLYIAIDPDKGLQWFLGRDVKDKDIFIKDFSAKVTKFKENPQAEHLYQKEMMEINASEIWVRKNNETRN